MLLSLCQLYLVQDKEEIMRFLWHNLLYLEAQFELIKSVNCGNSGIWSIWIKIGLLAAKGIHHFYLGWMSQFSSLYEQVFNFDWITLEALPAFHVYVALMMLLAAILYHHAYFRSIQPITNSIRYALNIYKKAKKARSPKQRQLAQIAIGLYNAYRLFYPVIDLYLLGVHFRCYRFYSKLISQNRLVKLSLFHHVNTLLTIVSLHYMLDVCILTGWLFNIFTLIIFERLYELNRFLERIPSQTRSLNWLTRSTRVHRKCLIKVLKSDHLFGFCFLNFLTINQPTNAYFVVLLLMKSIPSVFGSLFILFVALVQMLVNFLYHWIAAIYVQRLQKPAKLIHKLYLHKQRRFRNSNLFRFNLYFSVYFEALHCRNRYGITYYRTGLITMASFCKVLCSGNGKKLLFLTLSLPYWDVCIPLI